MKFESQEYRHSLAKNLKEKRSQGENDEAREMLEKEKEAKLYEVTRMIQELRRGLPKTASEELDAFLEDKEDTEDMRANFDIVDVSGRLTQEHRLFIELDIIHDFYVGNLEALGMTLNPKVGRDEFYGKELPGEKEAAERNRFKMWQDVNSKFKKAIRLLNPEGDVGGGTYLTIEGTEALMKDITNGEITNNHNLTHVVTGVKTWRQAQKHLRRPFDESSVIEPSNDEQLLCIAAGNVMGLHKQIAKPIIILTPRDPVARNFIKEGTKVDLDDPAVEDSISKRAARLEYLESEGVWWNKGISYGGSALLFLADLPSRAAEIRTDLPVDKEGNLKKIAWKDIASIIVNLRKGKVYFRKISSEGEQEVEEDIRRYRKFL